MTTQRTAAPPGARTSSRTPPSPPSLRRVIFVSQRRAEAMRVPAASALISITDPGRAPAATGAGWHAVLRVAFDDVDPVTFPGWDDGLQALSADQVAELAAFAAAHSRCCSRIVVHCRHGVSRSAAVVRAIAEAAGLAFPGDHDGYNRYVHQVCARPMRFAFGSRR